MLYFGYSHQLLGEYFEAFSDMVPGPGYAKFYVINSLAVNYARRSQMSGNHLISHSFVCCAVWRNALFSS